MPRKSLGPRLWMDARRGTWTILDGRRRVRTGMVYVHEAEAALERYIYAGQIYADNHPPSRRKKPACDHPNDLITLKEAAKAFEGNVSVETLRHEIAAGRIPGYRIGRGYLTSRASVDKLSAGILNLKKTELGKGVYILGYGDYVKIGITKNIRDRVETLQSHAPGKIEVYAMFEGWLRDEMLLHRRFDKYRTVGEWFEKKGELAEWIDGGCQ